ARQAAAGGADRTVTARGGERVRSPAFSPSPARAPLPRQTRLSSVGGFGSAVIQAVVSVERARGVVAAVGAARAAGLAVTADGVRVVVVAHPGGVAAARAAVTAHGGTLERSVGDLVQALVPAASLSALARDAAVELVRQPARPVPQVLVTGEEVATLNAAGFTASGLRGAGVKVGIIDLGFQGYAALLGTELPASVTTSDFCGGNLATADQHGTAVAEIVHEVAPDAQLYLICIDTEVSLAAAEAYAKAQGIRIINHSVGWFNTSRGDGSGAAGTPDAIVADARSNGILWVNSAGNEAQTHWSGTFVNDGFDFNVFSGTSNVNQMVIGAGAQACLALKWDAWPTTVIDYDLLLYRSSNLSLVAASRNDQAGLTLSPTEDLCFTNTGATDTFSAVISQFSAATAPRLDLFVLGTGPIQFQTAAGSLLEPASSPSALAVAAVCWNGFGLESYSSRGPNIAGVVKPDVSGYDAVSSAIYGASGSCGVSGFSGTSASSPGIAGAAALLLAQSPGLTPAQLQAKIASFAVDQGVAGTDNLYGAGRVVLPTLVLNTSLPTLSGTLQTGAVLTASQGTWSGSPAPTFAYQFERCDAGGGSCVDIDSASATMTYLLVNPADAGKRIRVKEIATNVNGPVTVESAATAQIAAAPLNSVLPVITGAATTGQLLTAATGTWTGFPTPSFTFQWERCDATGAACSDIGLATAAAYLAGTLDLGLTLRVKVGATNASGTAAPVESGKTAVISAPAGGGGGGGGGG
ncbi:MAG: S8 family serine peptidase, partial [Thermoleophilia bacterium]